MLVAVRRNWLPAHFRMDRRVFYFQGTFLCQFRPRNIPASHELPRGVGGEFVFVQSLACQARG